MLRSYLSVSTLPTSSRHHISIQMLYLHLHRIHRDHCSIYRFSYHIISTDIHHIFQIGMCLCTETASKYSKKRGHCQNYNPGNCSCKYCKFKKPVTILSGLFQLSLSQLIPDYDPGSGSNSVTYTCNNILQNILYRIGSYRISPHNFL